MHRHLFIFVFSFLIISNVDAQSQSYEYADSGLLAIAADTAVNSIENDIADTILYEHEIEMAADSISSWKSDKRFTYVKIMDSLLKLREREYLERYKEASGKLNTRSPGNTFSGEWIQVVFWTIVIGLVLFIIFRLFLNKGVFRKNVPVDHLNEIEDAGPLTVPISDIDARIQQAAMSADYRMAVRYLFIKTLHKLFDKGLLQQSADKTNFQYVQEIPAKKKALFSSLVLSYEYVWYGNQNISMDQYEQMVLNFSSFNANL